MTVDESAVLDALRTVDDPELHQDLVSLGMVESVDIDGDRVAVEVQLTTPACPMKGQIEADVRRAVSAVAGVGTVDVRFGAQVRGAHQTDLPNVKNVLAVGSGKGGVGKSTVAANLAASLALEGARVGLLDADIYGPSQAKMFAVEGKRLMADDDKNILPLKSHGVKIVSIGNLVEDGQALTWRGPILHGTLTQMLKQTVWGELTTPQEMSLADVRRAYTMFRKTHVPVLGVVENMSWYELPDGTRDPIFGEGGAAAFAASERIPLLGQIPITRRVRETGDAGTPVVIADPDSPTAAAFREAARVLAGKVSVQNLNTLPVL